MQGRWINYLAMLVVVVVLLSGCGATKVSAQKQDQDKLNSNTQGYLLIGLVNDYSLDALFIWGEKDLKLTRQDLSAGENYILIPVPAGEYRLGQINYNYYFRTKLDEDAWRFTIKPGQINYIGHLTVEQPFFWFFANNIELKNQAAGAQRYLEAYFPNLITERNIVYAGPGQDRFFEYIDQLEAENE